MGAIEGRPALRADEMLARLGRCRGKIGRWAFRRFALLGGFKTARTAQRKSAAGKEPSLPDCLAKQSSRPFARLQRWQAQAPPAALPRTSRESLMLAQLPFGAGSRSERKDEWQSVSRRPAVAMWASPLLRNAWWGCIPDIPRCFSHVANGGQGFSDRPRKPRRPASPWMSETKARPEIELISDIIVALRP